MSQKKNILKHTLSMGIASYIAQALGMLTSVAMRAFLGPVTMGIWTILQVILGYCGYASFGTTRAMARDYPILRGKGEHEEAEKIKDLTLTFSILMSWVPAFLILGFVLKYWNGLNAPFRMGLVFLSFFLFLQRFYDVVINLLRSDKKFEILSEVTVLNSLGMLGIVFVFVRPWNIYGLFIGVTVVTIGCLFYIFWRKPYHFSFYWNYNRLIDQLKLGLPLFGISLLVTFYKSLDKLLIAKYLGFADVGLYSIAMMITSLIFAFPMTLSNVIYPYMLEVYGASEEEEKIQGHFLAPITVLSYLIPLACGLAIYWMPAVVEIFIPKFTAGLPAMKIYLIGTYFILLAQFSSNVLTTLDRYWINYPIVILSGVLNCFLNLLLIRMGAGLLGVAWGTSISFIVYGLLTFFVASRSFEKARETWGRLFKILGLLAALFGGVFLIDLFSLGTNLWIQCFVKTACLILFFAPFLWFFEARHGFIKKIFQKIIPQAKV